VAKNVTRVVCRKRGQKVSRIIWIQPKVKPGEFFQFFSRQYFPKFNMCLLFLQDITNVCILSLNAKIENLFCFVFSSKKSTELTISSSLFDTKIQKHFFFSTHFSRLNIKINVPFKEFVLEPLEQWFRPSLDLKCQILSIEPFCVQMYNCWTTKPL